MYFTSGKDRAFETLIRASPVLIGTKTAAPSMRTATLAASIVRAGSISFVYMKNVRTNRAG